MRYVPGRATSLGIIGQKPCLSPSRPASTVQPRWIWGEGWPRRSFERGNQHEGNSSRDTGTRWRTAGPRVRAGGVRDQSISHPD